jgi:hypothetical protein
LVFKKNANFFRRKVGKIAENCDHNIDPWIASGLALWLPTITSDCYFRRHTFFCNLRYYVLVPRIRVIEVIFITHDLCSVVRAAGLPGFLGTRYRNQTKCTK